MPTDSSTDEAQAAYLQRLGTSIEELNARIARLAIALGVSLQNDHEVVSAMNHSSATSVVTERRSAAPDRRAGSRSDSGSDRRVAYKHVELRGLLVLRYGVTSRYVEQVGVTVTRQIMVAAEAQLKRDGFRPGADGVDLRRLFDDA